MPFYIIFMLIGLIVIAVATSDLDKSKQWILTLGVMAVIVFSGYAGFKFHETVMIENIVKTPSMEYHHETGDLKLTDDEYYTIYRLLGGEKE